MPRLAQADSTSIPLRAAPEFDPDGTGAQTSCSKGELVTDSLRFSWTGLTSLQSLVRDKRGDRSCHLFRCRLFVSSAW